MRIQAILILVLVAGCAAPTPGETDAHSPGADAGEQPVAATPTGEADLPAETSPTWNGSWASLAGTADTITAQEGDAFTIHVAQGIAAVRFSFNASFRIGFLDLETWDPALTMLVPDTAPDAPMCDDIPADIPFVTTMAGAHRQHDELESLPAGGYTWLVATSAPTNATIRFGAPMDPAGDEESLDTPTTVPGRVEAHQASVEITDGPTGTTATFDETVSLPGPSLVVTRFFVVAGIGAGQHELETAWEADPCADRVHREPEPFVSAYVVSGGMTASIVSAITPTDAYQWSGTYQASNGMMTHAAATALVVTPHA